MSNKMTNCATSTLRQLDIANDDIDKLETELEQVDFARKCLIYDKEKLQTELDELNAWIEEHGMSDEKGWAALQAILDKPRTHDEWMAEAADGSTT